MEGIIIKQIIRNGFFTLLAALLLGSLAATADVQAAPRYKEMHCESEVTAKTSVKINWKKEKGADEYRVYRSVQLKNDNWSKAKKIATLPSNQTSITDKAKYKKTYKYEIISFSKKGKKAEARFSDFCLVYMGVGQADWDEYLYCDAITTPNSIKLQYRGGYYGMMPDTYEIYRSTTTKHFKKIASVNSNKTTWIGVYTDRTVTYKTSYYYKVRAFKILNGKKIYGKFSTPVLLSAANSEGKFQAEVLTPAAETVTSLDILLTSNKGNEDTIFDAGRVWDASCWSDSSGSKQLKCFYSLDGMKWKHFSDEAIIIKPDEKIYLRFEGEDSKAFPHPAYVNETYKLWLYDLTYNRLTCYFTVDFGTNTGIVRVNGEHYH